ncbi:hypothetical protein SADUNF_Sadunf16G0056000 [Salix dunnii]|uniref:Uncharacterized protein n=1 Tax=Salix dunnii TaxID=1413687 RepID=A0A835J9D9_9ROSI|nr:hypothetical protein SADUNF_Sadunf16G0056000 [Salix dunnii]
MWLEAATVALENGGGFSTEYTFDAEISFDNGEPVRLQFEPEASAMAMKGFNFPAAACCENTATSDNAVPEVRAVPLWMLASSST